MKKEYCYSFFNLLTWEDESMQQIRNFVAKNMRQMSGQGAHIKTKKALRNKEKRELKKELNNNRNFSGYFLFGF